jgi:hypothetical protein
MSTKQLLINTNEDSDLPYKGELRVELELDVVGVAKDQGWAVSDIDDPAVRNAFGVQVRRAFLQFVPIRYLERQVIEADPAFVERF